MFDKCERYIVVNKVSKERTMQAINTSNTGVIYERGDGFVYLVSYNVCVAVYDVNNGFLFRTWNEYSASTAKHVGNFFKYINSKYYEDYPAFNYYDWKQHNANYVDRMEYCSLATVVREVRLRIKIK